MNLPQTVVVANCVNTTTIIAAWVLLWYWWSHFRIHHIQLFKEHQTNNTEHIKTLTSAAALMSC